MYDDSKICVLPLGLLLHLQKTSWLVHSAMLRQPCAEATTGPCTPTARGETLRLRCAPAADVGLAVCALLLAVNWVGSTKCQSAATVLATSSKRFVARNSAGLRGCACRRSEGVQILSDVSEPAPAFFIILVAQRS